MNKLEIKAARIKRTYRLKVMAHVLDYLNYKITGRHDPIAVCDKPLEIIKYERPFMFINSPEKIFQRTQGYITGKYNPIALCDKPFEIIIESEKPQWRTFYMFVDNPKKAFQWTERYIRGTDLIEENDFELCCDLSEFDYNTVINNIIDDDLPYLNEHREMMYSQLKQLFKCLSESRHSTGGISEYKIKKNDTVSIVAQKFQMTTEQVEDLNTDVEMVPGSVIKVMNKTSTHV